MFRKTILAACAALLAAGCAGEVTQLQMKDTAGAEKAVVLPKGTFTGGASKEQAQTLARIFVDSHNMSIGELAEIKANTKRSLANEEELRQASQRLESGMQKLDATSRQILQTSKDGYDTAQKTLVMLEQLAKSQGTGEITVFFPVGSGQLAKGNLEYERLINFIDYVGRERKGRKVFIISIGSASSFGDKKLNWKLAKKRSETPLEIVDKYMVNVPHEFFKVYGVGDIYSPKGVSMKEHQRYQHTRLVAFYEADQVPQLPAETPAQ